MRATITERGRFLSQSVSCRLGSVFVSYTKLRASRLAATTQPGRNGDAHPPYLRQATGWTSPTPTTRGQFPALFFLFCFSFQLSHSHNEIAQHKGFGPYLFGVASRRAAKTLPRRRLPARARCKGSEAGRRAARCASDIERIRLGKRARRARDERQPLRAVPLHCKPGSGGRTRRRRCLRRRAVMQRFLRATHSNG